MGEFRMFGGTVRSALVHALTQYDVRQARGKRYNRYALAQYLNRIDQVCADIEAGAAVRAALVAGFSGALLDCALKAVNEPKHTREESYGLGVYVPASR